MASLLFNWRVWVAVGLAALLFFMWSNIQAKKVQIANKDTQIAILEGDKTSMQQTIDDYAQKLLAYATVIDTLKADLVRSRKTIKELEFVRNEFNDLRKKFAELQDKPYTCPELETRYEDYSISISSKYNYFVRGKVNSMSTPSDSAGTTEAMPNNTATGTKGN